MNQPITAALTAVGGYVPEDRLTNFDLEKMVEEETFRRDLFYRLNVVPVAIPPLAQRREGLQGGFQS